MKIKHIQPITCLLATVIFSSLLAAKGSSPSIENDPNVAGALNSPPEPELTAAELALPPAGEIQKQELRMVNQLRGLLVPILAAVPVGADGQGSVWYSKSQTYKSILDTIAVSRLQSDCFTLIPLFVEIFNVEGKEAPDFAYKIPGLANGCSTVIVNAIQRHIIDKAGVVSTDSLKKFITFFSVAHFMSEGDWEAERCPIDAAGIFILDPPEVVNYLKLSLGSKQQGLLEIKNFQMLLDDILQLVMDCLS